MNKKNKLYKGRIDKDDAEWGMINRATLHELSLRIPSRNVIARLVYILLLTYTDKEGKCWPSQDTLAQILNVNRTAISKAYDTLRALGFIRTTKSKSFRSLKVQIYSVPHKLIFPEDPESNHDVEDNFPETEEHFSTNNNTSPEKEENTCMPEHTDTCVHVATSDCSSGHISDCTHKHTQIDHGTDQMNRPIESTTPPIVNYNPPRGDFKPIKEKPSIPASSQEIMNYEEYGTKIPALDDIDDTFIREQYLEIQLMFKLIRDWNIYWGFDSSEISFTNEDVEEAGKILDYNTYDKAMEMIQYLANEVKNPSRVLDVSYFEGYMNQDLYQFS